MESKEPTLPGTELQKKQRCTKDNISAYFCMCYETPCALAVSFLNKTKGTGMNTDTMKHILLLPPLSLLLTFINSMRLNNATSTVCEFCAVDWSTTSTGGKEQLQLLKMIDTF